MVQTKEETKHTPGEWIAVKADLYSDGEDSDPNRWAVCVGAPEGQFFIATIENGAPNDTLDTEEANAYLIAAAPDLLAACLRAVDYVNVSIARELTLKDVVGVRELLVAAIAKAEGKE